MRRLLAILLCTLSMAAWAALPPLSDDDRQEEADHILVGQVHNVSAKEVDVEDGTNLVYTLNFRVDGREKGSLRPGLTLSITCKQTGKRPRGWAGPQGQNEIPREGQKVRVFVRETPEGTFKLLEPNGWEAL